MSLAGTVRVPTHYGTALCAAVLCAQPLREPTFLGQQFRLIMLSTSSPQMCAEDYLYLAYDDKLYKPETAKLALKSLIRLLKACKFNIKNIGRLMLP